MSHAEVAVLGAGMAGLAAARALHDEGVEVVVLESRDRVGGRIWTDRAFAPGVPIELGAEFVHGEHVVIWRLIERLGLETRRWPKGDESRVRLAGGRSATMADAVRDDPELAATRRWRLPPELPPRPNEDVRSYLLRAGFSPAQLRYVQRWFANAVGESAHLLSAAAMLEILEGQREAGHEDHRVTGGYDRLPRALAEGLAVRTGVRVAVVEHGAGGVTIHDADGSALRAEQAIVTLPVGVIRSGAVRFAPELPDAKRAAVGALAMGPVIKLCYLFDEPVAEASIMAIYTDQRPPMWWSPSWGRPGEMQAWTGFVSGGAAIELLDLGPDAALDAALAALGRELGRPLPPPLARRLVDWPGDPDARGGYSVLLAGREGAREALAASTPPLFWAGEASEPEARAATVHGAYLSGLRAAAEVGAYRRGVPEIAVRLTARGPEPLRPRR